MATDSSRDLVLNPGEYAYMQDSTKGIIKTFVGPTVVNQTGQDRPVVFDKGRFLLARSLEDAVRQSPRAEEGQYLVLESPAEGYKFPQDGTSNMLPSLLEGRKVNIPGPCVFALWPGQVAKVIPGHDLKSNQFLLCRVYNDTEAKKNWSKAVMKPAADKEKVDDKADVAAFVIGQRLIIPGTEVSFFMPPTGVEVVLEEGAYVQEAVTLERLEFCILIDEDGNKRYEKGPQVVFPKPTEEFWQDQTSARKFKAIELNLIQGLHIKVIAAYEEGGKKYKEGDELFLTGKECAIYYPRPEHNIIAYGDKAKHYAVAVPAGEGRYVMNRLAGNIKTTVGPLMLLPNPVEEVIVRRILTDKQLELMYPGNLEAMEYNRRLRGIVQGADGAATMGNQYVPEGTYSMNFMSASPEASEVGVAYANMGERRESRGMKSGPTGATGQTGACGAAASDMLDILNKRMKKTTSDTMQRGTTFTRPRELTLDTKFDGVPRVQVWTGYAIKVVNSADKARIVEGPQTVLLDYDETLERLSLSTGKPKNDDKPFQTVYLRVKNNKVSDLIEVVTSDHVKVRIMLSYRVNFEGDSSKWFDVENYVKHLCDHTRSMLKGAIRHISIEKFYADDVAQVRDIVLGEKTATAARLGLTFPENDMHVTDVEVLDILISDDKVRQLLESAQYAAVQGNVQLAQGRKTLEVNVELEDLNRKLAQAQFETQVKKLDLEQDSVNKMREVAVSKEKAELAAKDAYKHLAEISQAVENVNHNNKMSRLTAERSAELSYQEAQQQMRISLIVVDTEAVVKKFGACEGGFSAALTSLTNSDTLVKVAEAMSVQKLIGGESMETILSGVFKGSHLEGVLERVMEKATAIQIASLSK
jgi:major vault protein